MIVCFFGDSLTKGVGDPSGLGWPGRLANWSGLGDDRFLAYNLGVRRNASRDVLDRFAAEARARLLPSIPGGDDMRLVFCFGAVDILTLESPDDESEASRRLAQASANARAILEQARKRPCLLIGLPPCGLPPCNALLERLEQRLAALADELRVPFLPLFHNLLQSGLYLDDLADDMVHPGAEGYELIARLVDDWAPWRDWVARDADA